MEPPAPSRAAAPAGRGRGISAERAPGAPTRDAPTHACPGRSRPFACRRLAQPRALTHPHTHTHAHSLRPPGLQLAAPRPPRRFVSAMASPGSGFWPFGAEEGSAAAETPGTGRGTPSGRAGPTRRSRRDSAARSPEPRSTGGTKRCGRRGSTAARARASAAGLCGAGGSWGTAPGVGRDAPSPRPSPRTLRSIFSYSQSLVSGCPEVHGRDRKQTLR